MTGATKTIAALAALLAGPMALAACRGYVPVRESEMTVESRLGWPVERCEVMSQPPALPAVSRLVDTLRLHELDAYQGPLSFGITVSARGEIETLRLLHAAQLTPEIRREWEDRLLAITRKQDALPTHWTVRLSRGDAGTWTVERAVYCAPRVAQSPGFARFYGTARPRGSNSVEVSVFVTETGFGQSVHLPNPPQNRDLDASIRQQAMALRFLPAMLNGEPVPSTFTFFVTLRRTGALRR